jgi:hypothetical protein
MDSGLSWYLWADGQATQMGLPLPCLTSMSLSVLMSAAPALWPLTPAASWAVRDTDSYRAARRSPISWHSSVTAHVCDQLRWLS